ncbi:hypothetical protein [Halococcus sp. IIIV-5B]|uniref:hypothetical protein n=1 Tax=Halococcus sp. IIIV-5B TaxID=2321230 RepID=UPI000E70C138|nr:hypothetical protein [Halococcus sp. IIIV-5B]RJT08105.1 hypothetical protein D3261_01875 [Halococcus sp. IIIV-5B]
MSVGVRAAIRAGARRTASRDGLVLALAFAAVGVVGVVGGQTLLRDAAEPALETLRTRPTAETGFTPSEVRTVADALDATTPLALGVSASVASGLVVLAGVLREVFRIVAVRTFAADPTSLTRDRLRPLVLPTLNGVVGGLAVWFLVGLGGVLGILAVVVGGAVAALFLATSFFFLRQEIAVENRNFVDALNESWRVASGHRLRLLGLGVAVVALTIVPLVVVRALFGVLFGPAVAWVAWVCFGGPAAVFGTATVTHAYTQLRTEPRDLDPGGPWIDR